MEAKQGRASGGTPVVIAGSGFSTETKVYFNDQAARVDAAKSSETTLFVYSPPGKVGEKADIAILNPDGASDTVTEAFKLHSRSAAAAACNPSYPQQRRLPAASW